MKFSNTFLNVLFSALIALTLFSCEEEVVEPPVADFSVSSGDFFTGKEIKFSDDSEYSEDCSWYFEGADNPVSTSSSPVVVWSEPGTYDITLVVSNSKGEDEITKTITIKEYIPYLKVVNNTPAKIIVAIGVVNDLDKYSSELSWTYYDLYGNKGLGHLETGETKTIQLWDEGQTPVNISGKSKFYYAVFSYDSGSNYGKLYSDDYDGGSSYLAWHDVGLSTVSFDETLTVDVSSDFGYFTIDNSGYSKLSGAYAFTGENINNAYGTNKTISFSIDEKQGAGYFELKSGMQFGSYYTEHNYVYWNIDYSQTSKNQTFTLTNSTYAPKQAVVKSTTMESKVVEGAINLASPRCVSIK